MKKIYKKLYAFSLAEALITLLIVCLITLASIPVLTKKRRTITDGGSGQWICTLVEQKDANGNVTGYKHVYWNSQTSDGDINDPSTWDVAGDGTSCTFAPPLKAKNFAVTLIGGGGGGADGAARREVYLDANNTRTQELPAGDDYYVAVVGGGGGGSVGSCSGDCKGTPAGSGNAGAYFLAKMNLSEPSSFRSVIGKGGAKLNGFQAGLGEAYIPGETWAYRGEDSKLLNAKTGQELVKAPGGGSGEHARNKNGCERGRADGTAESSTLNGFLYSNIYNATVLEQGTMKKPDTREKVHRDGFIIPEAYYGINYGPFGSGGQSSKGCENDQESGTDGIVLLWRILMTPGLGGNSSPLETTTLAKINGKLVATIGAGGARNQNGSQTTADIYDSQGKITRSLRSQYGTKGELSDEQIEQTPAKKYVYGKKGADSLWLTKGGGEPGYCEGGRYEQYTETYTDYETKITPVGLHWKVGFVTDTNMVPGETKQSCPEWNGEKIPCIGFFVSYQDTSQTAKFKQIVARSIKFGNFYTDLQYKEFNSQEDFENWIRAYAYTKNSIYFQGETLYVPEDSTGGAYNITQSWYPMSTKKLVSQLGVASYELGSEPANIGTKTEYIPVEKERIKSRYIRPNCKDAGNGTYFGAGGGGGGASNTMGLAGKGGKGAPGAVIIEW